MSSKKQLFGLYVSMWFVGDDGDRHFTTSSETSTFCICASYDKETLDHYCDIFNEADSIRSKIHPVMAIREKYEVKVISLI